MKINKIERLYRYRLGMPPKLIIRTNQKKYDFYEMQDYDESKVNWFFPINDRKMVELADSSSIVVMNDTFGLIHLRSEQSASYCLNSPFYLYFCLN